MVSFTDALQGLTSQIMQLAGSPDADVDFLLELRDMILGRIGMEQQAAAEQALTSMGAQPPGAVPVSAPPGGLPVSDGSAPRGLPMAADPSGAASALERAMQG